MNDLLAKCGIHSLQDLLFQLPYRYQDRTRITAIRDLRVNDWAVISGRVIKTEVKSGKRPMLICYVDDQSALLKIRFFHFNQNQIRSLKEKPYLRAFGEIRFFGDSVEMIHPEYQLFNEEGIYPVEETLTPIYPTTQGLSQTKRRLLIKDAFNRIGTQINTLEWLDEAELNKYRLLALPEALTLIHNPPPDTSVEQLEQANHPALHRLILEEFLAQQLSMQFARKQLQNFKSAVCPSDSALVHEFIQSLPFKLTEAQNQVCREIATDLEKNKPMLRLVQGDVGAGKTVVAIIAALQAIAAGYQVAFMAPTEILSEQHANTITNWLSTFEIKTALLQGKMSSSKKRDVLSKLKEGHYQLVVGTHALFQQDVQFANLGLIIIDEQHRFGVEQRLLLQKKGQDENRIPHQLLMTATPIPRTLAMAQYAHLDLSVINSLPPGRSPIITAVLASEKRPLILNRLNEAIKSGKQAYWVCTLIEESETLQCACATETANTLQKELAEARVGLIHGRMKSQEKERTMTAFKAGELDLLVATTVIEVGVDVPNASLMIIENAERLGLAQLHQLRGRVGRGSTQSYCLLLYQSPLSSLGRDRLMTMRESTDGFVIAEKDLKLRGSGEILGTKQTGYKQFKIADIERDQAILEIAQTLSKKILQKNPIQADMICRRWLGNYEQFLQG